ncbi:unnamed protein product [Coffea canephora]|uniref:Uncharacterized protein n=1 Tax=Coffea canephora TaxID=49390 RepID=A0A068UC72_COFCA|nr:unnamed protein product [Coffea canephora]
MTDGPYKFIEENQQLLVICRTQCCVFLLIELNDPTTSTMSKSKYKKVKPIPLSIIWIERNFLSHGRFCAFFQFRRFILFSFGNFLFIFVLSKCRAKLQPFN